MQRSTIITDFALATLAATTILLSLLPLGAGQQSPASAHIQDTRSGLAPVTAAALLERSTSDRIELTSIDATAAVANWQSELASFYARRDGKETQVDETIESEPVIQPASYTESTSSEAIAKRPATQSTATKSTAKVRYGVVLQDRHLPMMFFFAIGGGLLMGLGYLEWSRQTPVTLPASIEFQTEQATTTAVEFDSDWGSVTQGKAVTARRITLAGMVVWALATLVC